MRSYDDLSPHDFELLIRDLMSAELGVRFEAFSPGPDGGIDLRAQTALGTIVIQCKHYRRSRATDLRRAAAHEAKALALNPPDRYILATTSPMTPALKSELMTILSPHVRSSSDIIGPEDIEGLLTRHSQVERATPKLWLASGSVLGEILSASTMARTKASLSRMRETFKVYVPTPSLQAARGALQREMCCIIQGPAGIGKTTLSHVLAAESLAEGYEPIFISSDVDEALSVINRDEGKYVVVYDDFLGQSTMAELLGKNEDARMADLVQLAVESRRVRLIATTRDYILKYATSKHERLARTIATTGNIVINISEYEPMMRARVLYNHLYHSDLPEAVLRSFHDTRSVLKIIRHQNYNPRLVAGFSTLPMAHDAATNGPDLLLSHLDDPVRLWGSVLAQLPPECSDFLVVLSTLASDCEVSDFAKAVVSFLRKKGLTLDTAGFTNALRALEPTFLTVEGREYDIAPGKSFVMFTNPSVRDLAMLRLSQLVSHEMADLIASAVWWEQVAMLAELAFSPADQPDAALRSVLRYGSDRKILAEASQSLSALAEETDGFASAVVRTMFERRPRQRYEFGSRRDLVNRLSALVRWPRAIREGVLKADTAIGQRIQAAFAESENAEDYSAIRRLLGAVGERLEEPDLLLLEKTLRPAARELLRKAEAGIGPRPTDAAWWERSEWAPQTAWLTTAAQISVLYEFDDTFAELLATTSARAVADLLDRLDAIVGYTIASATQVRNLAEEEPEAARRPVDDERHTPWVPRRYLDSPEDEEVFRRIRRVMSLVASEKPVGTGMPYLPTPEAIDRLLEAVRKLLPFAADNLSADYSRTLAVADTIAEAGGLLNRWMERSRHLRRGTDSGLYGGGPHQPGTDLDSQISALFGTLGESTG